MVDGENKPRVWILTMRQSEITREEDRDKFSPTELFAWDLLVCLPRRKRGRQQSWMNGRAE